MQNTFVVIVTYNGIKWINKCLSAIPNDVCAVVVDNASTDGTLRFVEQHFPQTIVLQQPKNLGFGAANNIGISYALKNEADFVFLLNQDAYLQPTTIKDLIAISNENPEFGIISPIHLNGTGTALDANFATYVSRNKTLLFDALENKYTGAIYNVPFVNAAAWLLPKKTLETIGGFDPIFFHYGEDDNYCQRVLYHSLKIGVVPNTYVYHDREQRAQNTSKKGIEDFIKKERFLKLKWANVNSSGIEQLHNRKHNLKKLIFKLKLKLKFKKVSQYQGELKLINKIEPEIINSLQKNKLKGPHYLDITL